MLCQDRFKDPDHDFTSNRKKASPATTNQRLVALTRFFAWAVKEDLARENPAQDAGSLHLPVREAKGLPNRDLRRLLRAVHASGNVRDIAIVEVLTGRPAGRGTAGHADRRSGDGRAFWQAHGTTRETWRVSSIAADVRGTRRLECIPGAVSGCRAG